MTSKERQSRQIILKEIMSSMSVSKRRAEELLPELKSFKLVKFDSRGDFYLQAIDE